MATIHITGYVESSDPGIRNFSTYKGNDLDTADITPEMDLERESITDSWWRSEVARKFAILKFVELRENGILFQYGENEVFVEFGKSKLIDRVGLSYAYGELYVEVEKKPMLIHLPEHMPLEHYLAREAEMVQAVHEPTFFTWVVAPTVIYGKHQIRSQEVNETYCREHDIRIVQRQSGGGCVYADEGNLMISLVSPNTHSQEVFDAFLAMLSGALRAMGYEAVTTSHNDVLVAEHKVAGTACYTTPTGTVVHACMLYDVNLDDLQQAITPTAAKLAKHAVASVRQRVINLREIRDMGAIATFRQQLEAKLQHA